MEVLGGLLNNEKIRIYEWNVPSFTLQRIVQIMEIHFEACWNHFSYLGLLVSKENMKSELWIKHIEKMKKIQNWGMICLNLVGRVTLIKSMLTTLPIFQFAAILALTSIQKQIELIISNFLWQGGKSETENSAS